MRQECADFGGSHLGRVPLAVKQDVLSNPVEVGLFGAVAIMACADEVTHFFEQFAMVRSPENCKIENTALLGCTIALRRIAFQHDKGKFPGYLDRRGGIV